MKRILLEELKQIQVAMLDDFCRFCDEKGYTYFLAYGTLLGAVRHQGYIPWDDDIDLLMPRPDYEKAIATYQHDFYRMEYYSNCDYIGVCAVLSDMRTCRTGDLKYNGHVYIDVFPLDGIPASKMAVKIIYFFKNTLNVLSLASIKDYGWSSRYIDKDAGALSWKKYGRFLVKCFLIFLLGWTKPKWWAKLSQKTASLFAYGKSDRTGAILSPYDTPEIFPKEIFEQKVKVKFEGKEYWAPQGYDAYLKALYGDYMTPPPPEKRVGHHPYAFYWI